MEDIREEDIKKMKRFFIKDIGLEIIPIITATVTHKGPSFKYQTPKAFFKNIIKENLKDFYADDLNERKAINACITLYHLVDWYSNSKEEKKQIWKEVPYNDALESITNGVKHFNKEKPYQTGRITGTNVQEKLILNNGENVLEIKHILKQIEKYWDEKLKNAPYYTPDLTP